MFTATTRGILVRVEPSYLDGDSAPDENRWVWSYRVVIENQGDRPVQLLSRRWLVTDGRGVRREVQGLGVVGQQPRLQPGQTFEYTSGCPLGTPSGFMVGTYRMVTDDGEAFDAEIPLFPLDVPSTPRVLN
jgi:ApaG protein